MLFTVCVVLAGIIISALVFAGLVFGLPWLTAQRDDQPDLIDGDPSERFSESLRFVRTLPEVQEDSEECAEVSTPLMRESMLSEIRLLARRAAKRRRVALLALLAATVAVGVLVIVGVLPVWSLAIPGVLLVAFIVKARISVWLMGRRFDSRKQDTATGWGDEEDTTTIALESLDESSSEFRVDLAAPISSGVLWDPIPVTSPNYVSKPLVPRTVRTIDLSSPIPASPPVVPTADRPGSKAVDVELELEDTEAMVHQFRPRAVGE